MDVPVIAVSTKAFEAIFMLPSVSDIAMLFVIEVKAAEGRGSLVGSLLETN